MTGSKPPAENASALSSPPPDRDLLHGAVLRPPAAYWDGERYVGTRLAGVDAASAGGLTGLVQWVVQGDFVGVVALTPVHAAEAAARLRVTWAPPPTRGGTDEPRVVWSPPGPASDPRADREGPERDVLSRRYRWRFADTPAWGGAVAWCRSDRLLVWAACEPSAALHEALATLTGLPVAAVTVWSTGQPACAAAADAAADAALLSRHVGRPVRVGLPAFAVGHDTLELNLRMALDATAPVLPGYRVSLARAPWRRPPIASLLTGRVLPRRVFEAALPPYALSEAALVAPSARVPLDGLPHTDGASAAAFVFAHESFIDEAAERLGADPVDFRLARLDDPRGAALIQRVVQQAGPAEYRAQRGRGFAYASVLDDRFEPPRRNWSAWVAEVAVDRRSGVVEVTRVVVGHDAEDLKAVPDDSLSIVGRVQRIAQRLLDAPGGFDMPAAVQDEAPQRALRLPAVDLVRPEGDSPPQPTALAWSDAAALPAAAAVANAIFDATGVRLREPPFNGPAVRDALRLPSPAAALRVKTAMLWFGGLAATAAGLLVTALPWRPAIAPIEQLDLSVYSAAALERGRQVAAAGDCIVCHTAPGGAPNAGGLGLHTPFGTIYSTNITPDAATGIGAWSFTAFDRAMRQGIHRDGRHLYPAFPYTAFTKLSDGDMQALYAHLMSQPAVSASVPETKLPFPYSLRAAMAGWNLLSHDDRPFQPDAERSPEWNRGAYLVQGAGHCGGCHTPRNALGAEKTGTAHFLSGGEADGWEAPALNGRSRSPLAWTNADFYDYLRSGYSPRHGAAAGPMAPVVHGLASLPDSDIRAMAVYLASLQPPGDPASALQAADLERRSALDAAVSSAAGERGERLYQGACAVCHEADSAPTLFGGRPSLAANTNLHSDRPDNLLQAVLHGIEQPAHADLGTMPGFRDSLDDAQLADLLAYLRARFAPDRPAWENVVATTRRLRLPLGPTLSP